MMFLPDHSLVEDEPEYITTDVELRIRRLSKHKRTHMRTWMNIYLHLPQQ